MSEKILIYDIETAVAGVRPDAEKDHLRLFGCYSYITNEYYFLTKEESIRKTINAHDYLVGFNTFQYDNCVLRRHGFDKQMDKSWNRDFNSYDWYFLAKGKYNIDLFKVFKNRAGIITVNDENLSDILLDFKLDTICKTIGISQGKIKDFDYDLLKKSTWTDEEKTEIKEYTKRDLEITKQVFEWLEDYFKDFKILVSPKNVKNKSYIKSSTSAFAYKALCYDLKIQEDYGTGKGSDYGGGFVADPAGESYDDSQGDIYILDFDSLYPHVNIMCNLFCPSDNGWNGNGLFQTDGTYDDKNQGPIEQYLLETFKKRKALQEAEDPRQYALKIVLNSIYGMSSTPKFINVYRKHTASDCTSLGRQWTKLARKRFKEAGYENLYSDTDSVFILDKRRDQQRMEAIRDSIVDEIKANVPFPSDTFKLSIEAELSNLWFFKGDQGLLKKNYIYRTKGGKIVVKNLGVRKKSISKITRHIFWKILLPQIEKERKVKFEKPYLWEIIQKLLEDDLSLAANRYSVNAYETYKPPRSSLHAQIAQSYGPGIHFLIPNKEGVGVGKKKNYCSFDEFQQQGLSMNDIDLEGVWSELDYFVETKGIIYLKNVFLNFPLINWIHRIFGHGKKELQRAG